jgi:hypothetical protein
MNDDGRPVVRRLEVREEGACDTIILKVRGPQAKVEWNHTYLGMPDEAIASQPPRICSLTNAYLTISVFPHAVTWYWTYYPV